MRRRYPLVLACLGVVGAGAFISRASAARTAPEACHPSYPDFCIAPPPPDLDCRDIKGPKPFRVKGADPHKLDRDRDGWACER